MEEDTENANILQFRKSPAINRFLLFLEDCAAEGDYDADELDEIMESITPEEKPLLHLILVISLPEPDIQLAFENMENETFSSLKSAVSEEERLLTRDLYWSLVCDLELLEEALCMIVANPGGNFMVETARVLLRFTISNCIETKFCDLFLVTMAKLSRVREDLDYFFFFKDLLHHVFVNRERQKEKFELYTLCCNLLALFLIMEEDFSDEEEIWRLSEEWMFLDGKLEAKSLTTYCYLFGHPEGAASFAVPADWISMALMAIDEEMFNFVKYVDFDIDQSFYEEVDIRNRKVTKIDYVGAFSYMVQLLLTKRNIDVSQYVIIEMVLKVLISHKPKITGSDAVCGEMTFEEFFEAFKKHNVEAEITTWIDKFLTFPLQEVMESKEGLEVASTLFHVADFESVVKFIRKLFHGEEECIQLKEEGKQLILKICLENKFITENPIDFLTILFENDDFSKLQLDNFHVALNTLTSQISTIELEKDAKKVAEHKIGVASLCLQNPFVTLNKILEQSIRTEHYRCLEFALPFFNLRALQKGQNVIGSSDATLFVVCLGRLFSRLPDYPAGLYDLIGTSMPVLISKGFIIPQEIFGLLKFKILKQIQVEGAGICLGHILGGVALLQHLAEHIAKDKIQVPQPLQEEMVELIVKLKRFFYIFTTNHATFHIAMQIRDKLVVMFDNLRKLSGFKNGYVDDMKERLMANIQEDSDVMELGLLYVRTEELRSLIEEVIPQEDSWIHSDFKAYKDTALHWILNCCKEEWKVLIRLIFEVGWNVSPKVRAIRKTVLMNRCLLTAYVFSMEGKNKNVEVFTHLLKFYTFAVDHLKAKGELVESDWIGILHTLLALGIEISHPKSNHQNNAKSEKIDNDEAVALQRVLLLLLKQIEEFDKTGFAKPPREELISKVALIGDVDNIASGVKFAIHTKLEMGIALNQMENENDGAGAA